RILIYGVGGMGSFFKYFFYSRGYDVELVHAITSTVNIPVIASGGAGNPQHFLEAFKAGADAALAASIFHYQMYSIREIKRFLARHGIEVRM
ncbi:MAG TPA: hypothetical protein EYP08_05135, partial [Pyrodictiaceae archaeon]|nr:hypothetical protein [Pyrodictiaceae archaeon]